MSKKNPSEGVKKEKAAIRDVHQDLRAQLAKDHACYVLITCNEPTENGNMDVKMSFEGDALLASYLIQGAQNYIDEQQEEQLPAKRKK